MQTPEAKEETTCTRCGTGTEYYIDVLTKNRGRITLCSDCCMAFLEFAVSTNMVDKGDLADYATNTHP